MSIGTPDNSEKATKSRQGRVDNLFNNQMAWNSGGSRSSGATNRLLYMIAKDKMPYGIVEKDGFKIFIQYLCPLYKLPSANSVTRLMEKKYEVLSSIIKHELSTLEDICLTTDIWTDTLSTKSFIGVTSHYINDFEFKSIVIGVMPMEEQHTAEYICKWLENIINEWKINKSSIVAIVSDNAANMVRAIIDGFGEDKHLPCFAHTLNLVPSKVLNEDSTINPILRNVKSIVTFFKKSVTAADQLRKVSDHKLIQCVDTRWNSAYYMFERFIQLSDKVAPILLQHEKSPEMLSGSEMRALKEVTQLLQPFEEASKITSGESYVTGSQIIPIVKNLKSSLDLSNVYTTLGLHLKRILMQEFSKRFEKIEKCTLVAISTILDPRFKKMYFNDKLACANAINAISKMIYDNTSEKNRVSEHISQNNEVQISIPTSFWSHHKKIIEESKCSSSTYKDPKEMTESFRYYLNSPVTHIEDNPLVFWKMHYDSVLVKVAKRCLSIIATSVPSERLFSQAALILTEKRSKLTPEHFQQLLFLSSLPQKVWNLD